MSDPQSLDSGPTSTGPALRRHLTSSLDSGPCLQRKPSTLSPSKTPNCSRSHRAHSRLASAASPSDSSGRPWRRQRGICRWVASVIWHPATIPCAGIHWQAVFPPLLVVTLACCSTTARVLHVCVGGMEKLLRIDAVLRIRVPLWLIQCRISCFFRERSTFHIRGAITMFKGVNSPAGLCN
jgi:hypothetical protein